MVTSLSSENVIAALRARDEAQIQEENRKVAAQAKKREEKGGDTAGGSRKNKQQERFELRKKGQKKRPSCRD